MLKLISWNVNGLRACYDKGFTDIFRQLDADFFCLQETKMQAGQLDLQFDGYQSYWNYAEKKGYSGTTKYLRHLLYNPHYNPSLSYPPWIEQNTTVRAVSLLSKWKISSWSMSILPTRKKD